MIRMIDRVPKPLLDDLLEGRWLPIIGAGFSRNAVVPSGDLPLDWRSLGKSLGAELPAPDADLSTLEAISAYSHAFGRVKLIERVALLVRAHDSIPGRAHSAFARLNFRTVLTTNFDFLLEAAYANARRPCIPLVGESQLSSQFGSSATRLIKVHGDVHHPDSLIVTEDDYDRFVVQSPLLATAVSALLVDHSAILFGYSLDDPDMRQLLATVRSRLGRSDISIWTVQVNASEAAIARFERRGVRVINLPAPRKSASVGDQYAELFEELMTYLNSQLPQNSSSTDNDVMADLRMPTELSRSCFFAVPFESIGWYREFVFPEIQRIGLVPLTAYDVNTPGESIGLKVDALLARAAVVVVELGTHSTEAELHTARRLDQPLITVVTDESQIPLPLEQAVFVRPSLEDEDRSISQFVEGLLSKLQFLATSRRAVDLSEAQSLLQGGFFGQAVISAVSDLEQTLRERYPRHTDRERPIPFGGLVRMATESLPVTQQDILTGAVRLRNVVVHDGYKPSKREAQQSVQAVANLLRQI